MPDQHPALVTNLADRYRIERGLGAGGMATVYLAHDLRHDRRAALKILRPELDPRMGWVCLRLRRTDIAGRPRGSQSMQDKTFTS